MYFSVSLSHFVDIYLSLSFSLSLFVCLSVCLSVSLSLSIYIYIYIHIYISGDSSLFLLLAPPCHLQFPNRGPQTQSKSS